MKRPTFTRPKVKRPPLPSLKKAKDPLKGVQVPDDIEEAVEVELNAVQQGFRDRQKAEAERFLDATDSGFYTCVVFSNRAQNDAFLRAIGKLGEGDLFIDGRDLAALMKIDLPPDGGGGKPAKPDAKFAKFVRGKE
jgi:hypothetical protein